MLRFSDLNPFNHGTATIFYKSVSHEKFSYISSILKEGWKINANNILCLSAGAEKNSNNFRIETEKGVYLLKLSHINDPLKQKNINQAIIYLGKNEIKTPRIIPTKDRSTFYAPNNYVFCLYNFIDGENFDGSQEELKEVASEIGRLHKVLGEESALFKKIKELNSPITNHNKKKLEAIIKVVREHGERTDFDSYVLSILNEIDERSKEVISAEIPTLPSQLIHYDLHPHNTLFNPESKKLMSLLDFDSLRYSQRARDIGFGMHRFSRTYELQTERKKDVGVDVRERAELFLNSYLEVNPLTNEEIKSLSLVIEDEAIRRVMIILGNHYLRNDDTWSFDLPKQVTTLQEGTLFSF